MAEVRLRVGKDLEKSAVARSILITDAANEVQFVPPGANGTYLTIVAGVPTYAAITFPSEYEQVASNAARPVVGVVDVIYFSALEGTFSIWTGAAYVDVPASSSFIVAGNAGVPQTITGGNTLSIVGAALSGIVVTASATDTLTISLTENVNVFSPSAAATTVTATATPIASTLRVYRNGLLQILTDQYALTGTVVTFVVPFGISGGGTLSETVTLLYRS
jgi:hypothetical protein